MSSEPERVQIARGDDGSVVVGGELDAYTAPALDKALDEFGDDTPAVVLDLSAVTFIDSSALQVLVTHHQRLVGVEGRLELRRPSDVVVRLLDVSGLAALFASAS